MHVYVNLFVKRDQVGLSHPQWIQPDPTMSQQEAGHGGTGINSWFDKLMGTFGAKPSMFQAFYIMLQMILGYEKHWEMAWNVGIEGVRGGGLTFTSSQAIDSNLL